MSFCFKDKVVVVSGANGDLGGVIAVAFKKAGGSVVGLGHGWLPNLDLDVEMRMDASDDKSVQTVFRRVEQQFGKIDAVVNCVGVSIDRMALRLNDQEWKRILEVNLMGVLRCVKHAAPSMIIHKSGSIINISSLAARRPFEGQVAYAASKAAVEGMTRTLAMEWAPKRVRVNAIAPGFIEGKMTAELRPKARERVLGLCPLGRFAKPEEVAYAALFLASDESSYVTGQVLDVSGGLGM
jgi:3-oxoacyl-[acyl-carrier protein] reductase